MARESIKTILMRRDGVSEMEADNMIEAAREELMELIEEGDLSAAEDVCMDHFGLEPDYLDELMPI